MIYGVFYFGKNDHFHHFTCTLSSCNSKAVGSRGVEGAAAHSNRPPCPNTLKNINWAGKKFIKLYFEIIDSNNSSL